MQEYYCLNCKSRIPLEDINMQTNIALCRNCGEANDFLDLISDTSELARKQPGRVRFSHDPMTGSLLIRRHISPILFLLIPFTCFWSGLSMWGIYLEPIIIKHKAPELGVALFGIPFVIGTLALLGSIIYIIFGRTEIRMRRGEGSLFRAVGALGYRKRFRYDRETKVRVMYRGASQNEVPQKSITIVTRDDEISFGSFYREPEKAWITAKLKEFIRSGY